jgi:lysophospholipase L1-like esterase
MVGSMNNKIKGLVTVLAITFSLCTVSNITMAAEQTESEKNAALTREIKDINQELDDKLNNLSNVKNEGEIKNIANEIKAIKDRVQVLEYELKMHINELQNKDVEKRTECLKFIREAETDKSFRSYEKAEEKIQDLADKDDREDFTRRLSLCKNLIYTQDLMKTLDEFKNLSTNKDLYTYKLLDEKLIPKIQSSIDREYFKAELDKFKKIIFTDRLNGAVQALNDAKQDRSKITSSQQTIINNLCYENSWSMAYLLNQINELKGQDNSKEQILILGDSISLGMGSIYNGAKEPVCSSQTAWCTRFDPNKYEYSLIAVGGMGVAQPGYINGILTGDALDMLKYAEKTSNIRKKYDKIILAVGSNDSLYDQETYKNKYSELMDYLDKYYRTSKYDFINFYTYPDEMKEISDKYHGNFFKIDMRNIDKINKNVDEIHPSSLGYKQIWDLLKDKL